MEDALNKATTKSVVAAPHGWAPRVEFDDKSGEGVTTARPASDTPLSHEDILRDFNLDPDHWRVETVRMSRWQAQAKDHVDPIIMEACKASFKAISAQDPKAIEFDFEKMAARVAKWSRPKPIKEEVGSKGGSVTFVCALSDWQLGHSEGGGTEATVSRILSSLSGAVKQLQEIRQLGYTVERVALIGLGDIIENCSGHYDTQTFTTDLNMREQQALSWDLTARHIDAFTALAKEVLVTGVAGNHGEKRNGSGKAYTSFDDNYDLGILDVMDRYQKRDSRWSNVQVELPVDPLAHCVKLSGINVGFVHGHQFGKGQGAADRARFYWQGQALGEGPVARAQVLLSGHLHHFVAHEPCLGRSHFQAPAQNGGSYWFTSRTGQSAAPGMVTLLVGENFGDRSYDYCRIV